MSTEARRLAQFADAAEAAAKQFPRFKELARQARTAAVNAELDYLVKDSDPDDDTIVDTVTDENENEPKKRKVKSRKKAKDAPERDPALPNEEDPEDGGDDDDGSENDKKVPPPRDTSTQPEKLSLGDDRYRQDVKYKQRVDATVARVLAVHAEVTGRAPSKPAASVDDMIALAEHASYPDRVRILTAAITLAEKHRRGEV